MRIGTRWFYDSNLNDRRLITIANSGASHFGYTITPEGDITQIAESRKQQTWNYSYDPADRLVQASSSLGSLYAYGYDPGSSLDTIQTPAGSTYVNPGPANEVANTGTTAFSYDGNGNLLQDYARTYQWDGENPLLSVSGITGGTAYTSTFSYDGLGRRFAITTTSGGVTGSTHYGWCGQTLCQARDGNDNPTRRYFAEGEANLTDNALLYKSVDHLGSVRDVIAMPGGPVTNHFDYDPYGNPTTTLGSALTWTDFRYAGLFYHAQSGLYLAAHRAYDPTMGRWLSRDPIGENGGINLYAYASGNPLNGVDPQGFDESPAGGGTPGDPRAPGPPPQAPYEPGGNNNGDPSGTPCPPPPPPPVYGPPATPAATPTGGPPANDNMRDA